MLVLVPASYPQPRSKPGLPNTTNSRVIILTSGRTSRGSPIANHDMARTSISTAAPYFCKFLPLGAYPLVGISTFVEFAKAPQITPQMVALKLLANLLELHLLSYGDDTKPKRRQCHL
jgi:hypothetical protein